MLPKYYRFRIVNNTGQTMTYNDGARLALRLMPWKFASGVLEFGTAITDDFGFTTDGTLANGASIEGSVIDNSSELDLGVLGYVEETHDLDAAVGTVDLYVEHSDADGSDWPSDQSDFDPEIDMLLVKKITVDNSAVDKSRGRNFEWK